MQPIKKKVIAIVGATNAPGRGLVRAILNDGSGRFAARVVTLDVNTEAARALATMGAELVVGHVGAGEGLKGAFTGAFGAFCVPLVLEHPSPQRELAEITAIAQASKDAGLQHVIWATLGEARPETAKVFGGLGVPTTFLHAFGDPKKLRGERVAEEMGRVAYGILKTGEYIGKTVSIDAELLTGERKPTPAIAPPAVAARPNRARIAIPALAALVVVVFFLVRALSQPDPPSPSDPTPAAAGNVEHDAPGPGPTPPARATPQPAAKAEPAAPTVTSKWEQERERERERERDAPGTGAGTASGKKVAMAASTSVASAAAPSRHRATPGRYIKSKRHGRGESEDAPAEAPGTPARAEERPSPAPPVVASAAPEAPSAATSAPSGSAPSSARRQGPPPTTASVSPAPGYVDSKGVRATVNAHAAEVRTCYERAAMERPDLHGRLAIQATVDPEGHVLSATPTSTVEGGARLQACVVSAFRSWTFPAPAGGVKGNITYSFSFE